MTSEEKQAVRKEIEQRIADAEKSIQTLREQTKPVPPSVAIGRLTRMDAIQQKSMAEANLRSTENDIKNLKKALLRLDEDNFGVCVVCKGEIPLGRILAVPEAKVCVTCASVKR
ncbi:MAG: TraR/DksA family transcriptional regulator [Spirochaetota bacterium]